MNRKMFSGALAAPLLTLTVITVINITPAAAQPPPPVVTPVGSTVYSGSLCRAGNGGESNFQADFIGRFFNFDKTALRGIVCPISNSVGRKISGGSVRVVDQNPAQNVSCNVRVVGFNGNVIRSQDTTPSSGAVTVEQSLTFTLDVPDGVPVVLACSIPAAVTDSFGGSAASGIVSYTVTEDLRPLRNLLFQ